MSPDLEFFYGSEVLAFILMTPVNRLIKIHPLILEGLEIKKNRYYRFTAQRV